MTHAESFPKREHLVKTKDFRRAYKEGACFKKEPLALYRVANNLGENRVGFAVSARSIKLAARRNRIKRLLREAYRKTKNELRQGFDIVFSVRKNPAGPIKYEHLKKIFLELAGRADLLA
jgi:ribonuclease P protein component